MTHPEEAFAIRWMIGRTIEIGPGSNPTPGAHVTVDHTPAGQPGDAGSELGRISTADITADMAHLPFDDGDFDTLIARHVLEHHPDTLTVLYEWARVADRLVIICPDQGTYDGNTIRLDPTHRAAFTSDQLAALARHAGLEAETIPVIAGWSFALIAENPSGV